MNNLDAKIMQHLMNPNENRLPVEMTRPPTGALDEYGVFRYASDDDGDLRVLENREDGGGYYPPNHISKGHE